MRADAQPDEIGDRAPRRRIEMTGASPLDGSGQALLRHPVTTAKGCFLPDLTRFTVPRRAGPGRQHHVSGARPDHARPSGGEFGPA